MIPNEGKLLDLLKNKDVTFYIPPYQRNYEWDKEHCEVFFNDIVKTAQQNLTGEETEHFFGSVTYFRDDNTAFGQPDKLVLIDGQQRITTTMLFLVAVRDLSEDEKIKEFIDSRYLKNENVTDDTEFKVKLKQVETDWKAYCDVVLNRPIGEAERKSVVYQNYQLFKRFLTENSSGCSMMELVEQGISKFSVITIELKPKTNKWENPQEIFESMNSLGKPLTLADLVRNYLLLGLSASEQEDMYNAHWLNMEKRIDNLSDFIRDYMQLKGRQPYNKATDHNSKILYSDFKELFQETDAKELLSEMDTFSEYYAYITMEASCGINEIDQKIADLRMIEVTACYPFLIGAFHSWKNGRISDDDLKTVLDVLFIYFMRRRIIGLTQSENKAFPRLCRKLSDLEKSDDKRGRMLEMLAAQESRLRIPNNLEMEREMKAMDFYNFRRSKFLLSLVEEKITKSRPDQDDSKLQKEHIMPQTLDDKWRKALGENADEIHQEFVHTIGNITLIRHNQELGKKPFSEKKVIYINKTGLQIAKTMITDKDNWDKTAIEDRAEWIINYILKEVIPLPKEMERTNNFTSDKKRGISFIELQLIGEEIDYVKDKTYKAKVVSDTEVEFEGKKWKLSPLTREIETRRGTVTKSGAYSGPWYWEYDGIRLADII